METLIFFLVVIGVSAYAIHAAYLKIGWIGIVVIALAFYGLISWQRNVKRKREQEARLRAEREQEKQRVEQLKRDLDSQRGRIEEGVQQLEVLGNSALVNLNRVHGHLERNEALPFWEAVKEAGVVLNDFHKAVDFLRWKCRDFDTVAAKLGEASSSRQLVTILPDTAQVGHQLERLVAAAKARGGEFAGIYLKFLEIDATRGIVAAIDGLGNKLDDAIRSLREPPKH